MHKVSNRRVRNSVRVNKPLPAISPALIAHEREVYDADPTGGSASRY